MLLQENNLKASPQLLVPLLKSDPTTQKQSQTARMKLSVTLAALFAAHAVSNVQGYTNPITIKGYRMFDAKTGASFAVKGIDYYPRPNAGSLNVNNYDFFTDANYDVWKDDIDHLAATGANAVRLYAVDPSESHDKFMCALRAKGMYALIDLAAR